MRRKKDMLTAMTADPHWLYEQAVQDADITVDVIETVFGGENDHDPITLREDFCGTAKLCAEWVESDPRRFAVGVDMDEATLAWAMDNNIAPLGEDAVRVELRKQDVLDQRSGDFDVVAAFNFSYWVFHERKTLKQYFKNVLDQLPRGGLFILDLHGGPDAQFSLEESTEFDGFTYVWDQESFDPITHLTKCHIHFNFPDGSELSKAFTYDWRVWTIPEIRELLSEVGYRRTDVWWDNDDDGLVVTERAESLEAWIAYLAAWK